MAKEEVYYYIKDKGYDNVSGADRELYDLYQSLDGWESHTCLSGVDFPGLTLIFMAGCLVGRAIKRFM